MNTTFLIFLFVWITFVLIKSYQMVANTVTPSTIGVSGGVDIEITGNGFGTETGAVNVTINSETCVVKTVTMTTILCEAPALIAGTYTIKVGWIIYLFFGKRNLRWGKDSNNYWNITFWSTFGIEWWIEFWLTFNIIKTLSIKNDEKL